MNFAALCFVFMLSATGASASPVEEVVTLLKDLASQIKTDTKVGTEMYNKYACWCEKTTARKAADIEKALADMRALSQQILSLKGKAATLKAEIDKLAADIAANVKAQEDATNIRSKQNSEYMAFSAESKDALAALQSAITVLKDATLGKGALLQAGSQAQARMAVQRVLERLPMRVSLPVKRMSMLSEFMTGASEYAPQSATIQGILVDMYTTFASDLQAATQLEADRNRDYEDFIATKTKEKKDMEAMKASKEDELASTEKELAEAEKSYEATKEQKEADVVFFDETKAACTAKWEEWSTRSSLRTEELEGIEKAIEILTADEARDTFRVAIKAGKETGADESIDPLSFFQHVSDGSSARAPVLKAYNALKALATHGHSLRFAALAVSVRTTKVGHFQPVIAAIDKMMATLKAEAADDLQKQTTCIAEFQKSNLTMSDLTWQIEVNDANIEKLQKKIDLKTEHKLETIAEIKATEEYIAAITQQRKEENTAFLAAKAEDQKAIGLLTDARKVLMAYYKKNKIKMGPIQGEMQGLTLVQAEPVFEVSEDQAPDATFQHMGSHKNEAKDIVSLMTYLIQDLEDEVRNGISTEAAQLAAYEKEMAAAEATKKKLIAKKVALEKEIADAENDKEEEEQLKSDNQDHYMAEEDYLLSYKPDCDWVLSTFDKRAEDRAAEMNGLTEAKEYLAGYQASLLETPKHFDDEKLANIGFLGIKH